MEIISIKPEQRKSINPYALQKLDEFMNDLRQEGHLKELTDADFAKYLSKEELKAYINLRATIVDWLVRCSQPGISIDTRSSASCREFTDLRNLVREVYKRRQAKQKELEEQQRKKEAEREGKWRAATRAVNPPLDHAKRYLDNPGEYDKFKEAAVEAIQVYLEKGEEYLDNYRTFDYRWWLGMIDKRKDEERRKTVAESEARRAEQAERERLKQVKAQFSCAEEEFKQKLSQDKLPLTYPLEQYHPDLWFNFKPLPAEEILTWLRPEAYALIPEKLRELVTWRWLSKHGILIQAHYEKEGIPCIAFNFLVTIVARVIFYFKAGTYNYSGFTLKQLEEEGLGEVIIQKKNYEPAGELSVPISLLCLLISDQLEAQDIEVTSIYDNYTVYRVRGFKGEVTIHHDFRRFLRDICHENGLVNGLLAWGLIDDQIAEIVETKMNELGQLQAEQKPSSLEDNIKRKGTKKARAFQLFSQGKRPSDSEVKILGIKPETAYRYYQNWKKIQHSSQNPT